MKRILLFLIIGHCSLSYAQITVDNSFTTQAQVAMLVEDVLIGGNSSCASISNVTKRTGLNSDPEHEGMISNPVNGIGSFNANGSGFVFDEGIILMSGDAATAPGPNAPAVLSGGGADGATWDGDDDLNTIIGLSGVPPDATFNATYVTFDFTPNIDFIEFNFIFASEEYDGGTECGFNDAFAFILTDLVTGTRSNLAIVPGTTDPISTFTIRDLPEPEPCPDVNPTFFDTYNQSIPAVMPDPVADNALIALNGQTVPLTAQSTVVPGRTYNIKLVVADQGDALFDIAVFLEAGSFNIGVDLGDDLTVADDTALCDGDSVTFDASPGTTSTTTFEWQIFNPVTAMFEPFPIPETNPTLTIADPGTYKVIVTYDSGCTGEDIVVVEIFDPPVGTNTTDTVCSSVALAHDLTLDVSLPATFEWIAIDNPDPLVTGEQTVAVASPLIDDVIVNLSAVPQVVRYEVQATGSGPGMCPAVVPFFVDVTVNPQPSLATNLDTTVCSDIDAGITLATATGSVAASTYNITAINFNGLLPSNGSPVVANGLPATEILDDAYTNWGTTAVDVVYTIVPVSAAGCEGFPLDVTLTVAPEPIMATGLNRGVCSDEESGIVLNVINTGILAGSYNILNIASGLPSSAGAPVFPALNVPNTEIQDDAWTNTGTTVATVVYTVQAVGLNNCIGDPIDIVLTVEPEPVGDTNLDAQICSGQDIALIYGVEAGSIAATSYNLTAITVDPSLIPNPANQAVANGVAANYSQTDQYTNTSGATASVFYTYAPVSPDNCVGDPITVEIEILSQPILLSNLDTAVCSDDPSGILLDTAVGSTPAITYSILSITNPAGLVQSGGGTTVVGSGFLANEIADDAYTNPTTLDAVITYEVAPVSADGCIGDAQNIDLTVLALPTIVSDIPVLNQCDDAVDGADTNGFVTFDLSQRAADILGGQTNIDLAYFEDAGLSIPILNPMAHYSNTTTIFVTLTRNDLPQACTAVNSFDIVVRPKPVLLTPQANLVQCDTDIDGFSTFNLTEAEPLLSADFVNETFTYFDPGGILIPDPTAYVNQTVTTETISVTISTLFGCERDATVALEVDTSSIPSSFLLTYEACDTDFDQETIFDFSNATAAILALFPPGQLLDVSYYESDTDALAETNPITDISNFQNDATLTDDITGIQPIWVRVDGDSANDCQGLGIHINLVVLPNPPLNAVSDLVECRDTPGTFAYDLTQKDVDIRGSDASIMVFYYETLADYTAVPPNPIPAPASYTTSSLSQTILYSTASADGCTSFDENLSFDLIVNPNPNANDISDYNECGDGFNGAISLDLTENDSFIGAGNTVAVAVSYHLSLSGAEAGDLSIIDPSNHTTTPPMPLAPYT
ncbi:MAG: PKD-like domain-containing protein, partial [Dokdonia sp.]